MLLLGKGQGYTFAMVWVTCRVFWSYNVWLPLETQSSYHQLTGNRKTCSWRKPWMLDATFPSRGFNSPEYYRIVVEADLREQGDFYT